MKSTLSYYATLLHKDFLAYTTEQLQEVDLSFGLLPLVIYVGKHPGCTQAELTADLELDWGYSQRSITKLVNGGFIIRNKVEGRVRSRRMELTELGRRAFEISHQVFFSWDRRILGALSGEEQDQLLQIMEKLVSRMKEEKTGQLPGAKTV